MFGVSASDAKCLVAKHSGTRGETSLGQSAVSRLPGPTLGQQPPKKYIPGRKQRRQGRNLKRMPAEYVPCTKGAKCKHGCRYVTAGDRRLLYQEYKSIRDDLRSGAKYRGYVYIFQFLRKVKSIRNVTPANWHSDATSILHDVSTIRQSCVHCQCDEEAKWNPPNDHVYSNCNRRDEVQHGTYFGTEVHLPINGCPHRVWPPFFWSTFGISKRTYSHLLEYAGASRLPKDKFSRGGTIKSSREQLVRLYIATIPRHFSHYSPTSTSEYVACASSCLNWWKGPLEVDQDGTHPLCFLQWLDKRNDTNDYHIY